MSSVRLRAELLAARDAREALLIDLSAGGSFTLIFASTGIPGPEKSPPGTRSLFEWGIDRLQRNLDSFRVLARGDDLLGPYRVLASASDPLWVKRICVSIETGPPAARLLDLDVYGADRTRIGRGELGAAPRPCLLCVQPAGDCIRLRRHPMIALLARVDELLSPFNHAAIG